MNHAEIVIVISDRPVGSASVILTTIIAIFMAAILSHPTLAETDQVPKWELGVAGAVLSIPHYIGSDQRHTVPLAAPFLIYRGDVLKSDREGVRGELFHNDSVSVDIGFSFGLPVKNNNNARHDMPDLHLTGQIGPRINWTIHQPARGPVISLHLPIRYARDIKNNELGWVTEPSIRVNAKKLGTKGKFSARMDAGLLYAGKRYNQYYYDVLPQFSTDTRPAYASTSGLNHYYLNLSSAYHLSRTLNIGGFVRWKTLSGGVVNDSPLVTDQRYFSAGLGLSWIFKQAR